MQVKSSLEKKRLLETWVDCTKTREIGGRLRSWLTQCVPAEQVATDQPLAFLGGQVLAEHSVSF